MSDLCLNSLGFFVRRSLLLGSLLFSVASCDRGVVPIEFEFKDSTLRERVNRIMITVAEPFATTDDSAGVLEFVQCSEIGFFTPLAKYSREEKQLSGVRVYVEREFREYPITDDWDLSLSEITQEVARNPWQAMLVYVEARGQAFTGEDTSEKTLLAGCRCVRKVEDANSGNPDLDALIQEKCDYVGAGAETSASIQLEALIPEAVKLEPCRSDEYSIPKNSRTELNPGLCLRVNNCSQGQQNLACINCVHNDETKCATYSNVPVRLSLDAGAPASLTHEIVLTDENGGVQPELEVKNCTGSFVIQAQVLGRVEPPREMVFHCVDSVGFDPPVTYAFNVVGDQKPKMTVLPDEKSGGVQTIPPRLAVLSNTSSTALQMSLLGISSGSWEERSAPVSLDRNIPFDIHGYHYRVSAAGRRGGEIPVLAVATGKTSTIGAGSGQSPEVKVRLELYTPRNGTLEPVESADRPCDSCACEGQASANCNVCKGVFTLPFGAAISIEDADVDNDGYADLALGHYASSNTGGPMNPNDNGASFAMSIFYSAVTFGGPGNIPFYRNDLAGSCSCYDMGYGVNDFTLLRWGGTSKPGELWTVDAVFGEMIGGAAQYGRGPRAEGPPCDLQNSSTLDCGNGRECRDIYGNGRIGTCLEPCTGADASCTLSANTPYCMSEADSVSTAAYGYCGGEGLACLTPSIVWRLFYVRAVDRGQFTTSAYEDAVMIGEADSEHRVRVLYGGTHDHSTADRILSAAERNRLHYDLIPTSVPGIGAPTDPRYIAIEDYNGDGVDDVAVLYVRPLGQEQIRIWLGVNESGKDPEVGVRGLGPGSEVIQLNADANSRCDNPSDMIAQDLDGDGRGDIVVMCRNSNDYQLRWYRARAL